MFLVRFFFVCFLTPLLQLQRDFPLCLLFSFFNCNLSRPLHPSVEYPITSVVKLYSLSLSLAPGDGQVLIFFSLLSIFIMQALFCNYSCPSFCQERALHMSTVHIFKWLILQMFIVQQKGIVNGKVGVSGMLCVGRFAVFVSIFALCHSPARPIFWIWEKLHFHSLVRFQSHIAYPPTTSSFSCSFHQVVHLLPLIESFLRHRCFLSNTRKTHFMNQEN